MRIVPASILLPAALAGATPAIAKAPDTAQPPSPAHAVPPSPREDARLAPALEAFVGEALSRFPRVPGLAVAIARAEGPLLADAFGLADIEQGVAATPDTLYYIASSTKSFVGLALARLDARGEIDLDWTLAELAPGVRFDPEVRAGEITLRHLLTHRHGLANGPIAFRLAYSGQHDAAALLGLLERLEPDGEAPLGTFDYGNIGYNLATLLVERRLGRSWQRIVEAEVLEPLGLSRTIVRGLADARGRWPFASPYDSMAPEGQARLYLIKHDDTMQSGGGMYSTARDMARWIQVNLAAARGAQTPIPAAAVAATHGPIASLDGRFEMFARTGYGLGWYSGAFDGTTLFHSFGSFAGARAHVSFMPERNLGVAVLANDEGVGFDLADAVAIFAYDWVAHGPEAAQNQGRARLDRIAALAAEQSEQSAVQRAERAQRSWQLSLPRSRYAGRFCSPAYGTITFGEREGRFEMSMGRLHAVAEPFTETDAMRFEPIPGSGMVIQFAVEDGAVVAAQGFGSTFRRCDALSGQE